LEKIVQQYLSVIFFLPSSETPSHSAKFEVNNKFYLINACFSNLRDFVIKNEEAATHAKLDAGLVGQNLVFCKILEHRFREGFKLDG
jgi:hypothetical protein